MITVAHFPVYLSLLINPHSSSL